MAYGVFNYTTLNMVTDLNDAEREKCKSKGFQRIDCPPELFLEISS